MALLPWRVFRLCTWPKKTVRRGWRLTRFGYPSGDDYFTLRADFVSPPILYDTDTQRRRIFSPTLREYIPRYKHPPPPSVFRRSICFYIPSVTNGSRIDFATIFSFWLTRFSWIHYEQQTVLCRRRLIIFQNVVQIETRDNRQKTVVVVSGPRRRFRDYFSAALSTV